LTTFHAPGAESTIPLAISNTGVIVGRYLDTTSKLRCPCGTRPDGYDVVSLLGPEDGVGLSHDQLS
jgi:hypothetical protein